MIQQRLYLILLGALAVCAGCCHARNLSAWGHSPQTAVPVDSSTMITPLPPPSAEPPPSNPVNTCAASGDVLFSTDGDDHSPTRYEHFRDEMGGLWPEIKQDYKNYYSWDNFGMLAAGFSVAAVFANTSIDRELSEHYQHQVRSPSTDHFARICKDFGTGEYMLSAMGAGWVMGDIFYDWPVGGALGEWGERSLRSVAVGGPPMLLMQQVTGGARPFEDDDGSGWRPFSHSNGVSGHAFVGGVVFINAAKMTDDPWLKAGFYACSFLPAWSRINDDAHFPSQAFLGWWMAYCAATAVDTTNSTVSQWHVVPMPMDGGTGMAISYQY